MVSTMYPISTISDILRQGVDFGSVVRALDFYPSGLRSNPIRDLGFFQTMHHILVTYFHIRKMGLVRDGSFEIYSHKNDLLVSINDYFLELGVCYIPLHHSFIRDYLPWLEGWVGRSHDA